MTVEESRQALDHHERWCELHDGQIVDMAPPTYNRQNTRHRLFDLLSVKLRDFGEVRELIGREAFCFANGTQSFWVVNPPRRTVTVTTVSGQTQTYTEGDHIPLQPFASDSIAVNDIFS